MSLLIRKGKLDFTVDFKVSEIKDFLQKFSHNQIICLHGTESQFKLYFSKSARALSSWCLVVLGSTSNLGQTLKIQTTRSLITCHPHKHKEKYCFIVFLHFRESIKRTGVMRGWKMGIKVRSCRPALLISQRRYGSYFYFLTSVSDHKFLFRLKLICVLCF